MPKIISNYITKSQAEIDVLDYFKKRISQKNWVIIHSLHNHYGIANFESELDFLVMIPNQGLVLIEVKGATSVQVDDDGWYMPNLPKTTRLKDPFAQLVAAEANLRRQIRKTETNDYELPIARIVWFPFIERSKVVIEENYTGAAFEEFELKFGSDLQNPEKTLLRHLEIYLKHRKLTENMAEKPEEFTDVVLENIKRQLIPNFRIPESTANLMVQRKKLLRKIELEHEKILDLIDQNPNIYLTGPAGSGKSQLLTRLALDIANQGHQVLLTCHNIMMADWLSSKIAGHPNITVDNLGNVLLKVAGKQTHKSKDEFKWYEKELPGLALDALENKKYRPRYTAIIIDEFQDIASNDLKLQSLKLLLAKGKNQKSRFIFAGDDQQQILSKNEVVDSFEKARFVAGELTLAKLSQNCRQTPVLAKAVYDLLGRSYPFKDEKMHDEFESGLEVIACDEGNQARRLLTVLERLKLKFPEENIRILCFDKTTSLLGQIFELGEIKDSAQKSLAKLCKQPVKNPGGQIKWRTIRKYKGLDEDAVVIIDVSKKSQEFVLRETGKTLEDMLYVGTTRAKFKVVMLVQDHLFEPTHIANGETFKK